MVMGQQLVIRDVIIPGRRSDDFPEVFPVKNPFFLSKLSGVNGHEAISIPRKKKDISR
jgi:hypothetical protein